MKTLKKTATGAPCVNVGVVCPFCCLRIDARKCYARTKADHVEDAQHFLTDLIDQCSTAATNKLQAHLRICKAGEEVHLCTGGRVPL